MPHVPMEPRLKRIVMTAARLRSGQSEDLSFLHSTLCQVGIPQRRQPIERRTWEQKNGFTSILVEAGQAFDPEMEIWRALPLPFGARARLMLIHISTEAVRTNSSVIHLERSMTATVRSLIGRPPNSRDIYSFKTQVSALAAATIRFATGSTQVNTQLISGFDLWWMPEDRKRVLWPTYLTLSSDYFETLKRAAVPLDKEALHAIQHSALALDTYVWLAQRLWRINARNFVPWSSLHDQFGAGYKNVRHFRRDFLKTLRSVLAVYPAARIDERLNKLGNPAGLDLWPSLPPVARR